MFRIVNFFRVTVLRAALYKCFPEIHLFYTIRYVSKQLIHYKIKSKPLE
jgi:hypothetical protein